MSRRGPIVLPPSAADLAVSRFCLRHASPSLERGVTIATWFADEKAVLAGTVLFWAAAHLGARPCPRHEADRMILSVLLAGVVPHLFKYIVRRRRPNRSEMKRPRNGVPRSGNAWDSFPSGHAMHVGAIAGSITRIAPPPAAWRCSRTIRATSLPAGDSAC
jgi:membrane-associated phospholipid phosphatase